MIGLTQILAEGGNVKGVNSFVDNRFSQSTVKSVINKIKFTPNYTIVGSVDKKISGDVDLAVDWKDALKFFKTDRAGFWDAVDKYLKTKPVDYEIMKGLGQFSVVAPMVDDSGKVQKVVKDRQGTLGDGDAKIQIDFMIGNSNWMEKSFKPDESSKYKLVYKNVFLADILSQISFDTDKPGVKKKFQVNWREGLQIVNFTTTKSGKRKKLKVKTVTGNLDKFYQFLFGKGASASKIKSFEEVYRLFKSSKFRFPKKRKAIVNQYKKTIKRMKLDLPREVR